MSTTPIKLDRTHSRVLITNLITSVRDLDEAVEWMAHVNPSILVDPRGVVEEPMHQFGRDAVVWFFALQEASVLLDSLNTKDLALELLSGGIPGIDADMYLGTLFEDFDHVRELIRSRHEDVDVELEGLDVQISDMVLPFLHAVQVHFNVRFLSDQEDVTDFVEEIAHELVQEMYDNVK